MLRPVHFEIQCDNPERAIEFYTKVFGWDIQKWENGTMEYWMVMTAPKDDPSPGINGGLHQRKAPLSGQECNVIGFVCTMDVPSIDDYVEKITTHGGTLVMPKFDIAGMAWQAYCKDTEGNIIGLHEVVKKSA